MRISDWSSDVCSSDLVGEFNFESDGAAVFANSFAVLPELIGNCSDLVEEDRSVGGISLERVLAAIGLPFSVGTDRSIIFTPRDRVIIGAGFTEHAMETLDGLVGKIEHKEGRAAGREKVR